MRNSVAKIIVGWSKNNDGSQNRPRYQALKRLWNATPRKERKNLTANSLWTLQIKSVVMNAKNGTNPWFLVAQWGITIAKTLSVPVTKRRKVTHRDGRMSISILNVQGGGWMRMCCWPSSPKPDLMHRGRWWITLEKTFPDWTARLILSNLQRYC